jgi:putative transcription factor
MGGQDWDTVVLRKKKPTSAQMKDEGAVNAARRTGADVETMKKFNAGSNKAGTSGTGKSATKLDQETEVFRHETVNRDLSKQIVAARTAKKLTQAQLAQMVNEKPQIIQEYESGKAIPNPQVLSKLSRSLGVVLSNKKK